MNRVIKYPKKDVVEQTHAVEQLEFNGELDGLRFAVVICINF